MILNHGAYYYKRNNKWLRLSDDYTVAVKMWAELEAKGLDDHTVFSSMLDRYIAKHTDRLADKTLQGYLASIERLKPAFGEMEAEDVTPADVATYRDNRTAKTAANREIALLSAAFNDVIELGWVTINPCRGVRMNRMKKIDRYATDDELKILIANGK
jgi:site-specific recombinase XerD